MRYRVLCADFRETLAACEGRAALIAFSPPYPSEARTCYPPMTWEDYQDLGDAVKAALLPGGHCLMNLSAPVRQMRKPALSDLLKKRADIHADLAAGIKPTAELRDVLAEIEAALPTAHGTERDPMPWRVALDWYDRVELTMPDTLAFGRMGLPGEHRHRPGPGTRTTARSRSGSAERRIFKERLRRPAARSRPRSGSDIVACFSDTGDLVCDPFLGGGTTLCAACDGDRRFIGGDVMEEWAEKSQALADSRYAQMSIEAVSC